MVGQASSEAFARGKEDPVAFAKKLRAGFLLDGAVQIVGDVLSVTIDLLDGKTGVSLTNRPFEKPMGDILSVQREIGSAISAELSNKIGTAGLAKSDLAGTKNVVAFDHYLRGKDLYAHAKDEAEERQAVVQFDAAIAADPKFAAAYAARARSLAAISGQYGSAAEIKFQYDAAIVSTGRPLLCPVMPMSRYTAGVAKPRSLTSSCRMGISALSQCKRQQTYKRNRLCSSVVMWDDQCLWANKQWCRL